MEFRVTLEGYKQLSTILKGIDPELRREMDSTIRSILRPIAAKAKTYIPVQPLSGWNYGSDRYLPSRLPFWNYDAAIKGIRVRQGSKRNKGAATTTSWRIENKSPAGAVFELAGRGPSQHYFVKALMKTHGRPSRAIWRAWDEAGGEKVVGREVVATIDDYASVLQRDLNSLKGS